MFGIPRPMRISCLAILLVALLCRAWVPAGYMPNFGVPSAGLMALRICTGDGFATVQVPAGKYAAGKPLPARHHTNVLCDYALSHQPFGMANAPIVVFAILLFVFIALSAHNYFYLPRRADFGTMAARAPPLLS